MYLNTRPWVRLCARTAVVRTADGDYAYLSGPIGTPRAADRLRSAKQGGTSAPDDRGVARLAALAYSVGEHMFMEHARGRSRSSYGSVQLGSDPDAAMQSLGAIQRGHRAQIIGAPTTWEAAAPAAGWTELAEW